MTLPRSPANQRILQEQELDPGSQEGIDRLSRRIHDRLTLHVEARIEHHLAPCQLADLFEQSMELEIVLRRYRLHARRAVHVRNRR